MIWSVRRKGCLEWFNDDDGSFDRTNLIIHLTGPNTNQTSAVAAPPEEKYMSRGNENSKLLELEATTSTPSDKEKLFDTISESGVNFGRCNISKVLREYAEELGPGERLAVLVCGPVSMLADTANAVAKLQFGW
ncbi:hypothetical protein I308_106524 [Cryptococcus tetragattii IND107]|uniref:Ferric reductase NAD binding domain-containing protein n=1 Tax=Cryptococcus tetragattii IND107 TaxID=1296105 RepID=A0ABR3BHT2_9TREE